MLFHSTVVINLIMFCGNGTKKNEDKKMVVFLGQTHVLSEIIVELVLNMELLRWKTKNFK